MERALHQVLHDGGVSVDGAGVVVACRVEDPEEVCHVHRYRRLGHHGGGTHVATVVEALRHIHHRERLSIVGVE